jgi:hypothetical protein
MTNIESGRHIGCRPLAGVSSLGTEVGISVLQPCGREPSLICPMRGIRFHITTR